MDNGIMNNEKKQFAINSTWRKLITCLCDKLPEANRQTQNFDIKS